MFRVAVQSILHVFTFLQVQSNNCPMKTKWIDITDKFISAAATLSPGILIHEVTFSLYDAMSAIELMDSKMDAIVQWDRYPGYPHSLQEALRKNQLKLEGHSPSELIGIFDEILACVATWLSGHTLAQTVFTCLYLIDPTQLDDFCLSGFGIAVVRAVDMLRDVITKGGVYTEDEQQIIYIGLNMLQLVKNEVVFAALKSAQDKVQTFINADECSMVSRTGWNKHLAEAVMTRINFIHCFFSLVSNLKKRTLEDILLSEQELPYCLTLLSNISSTVHLGQQLDPADPLILGFHPLINQHLLPPSYRTYEILSRDQAMSLLTTIIEQLKIMYEIGRLNNLSELFSAVLNLSSVEESPNVLVRSYIAQLCLNNDRCKHFGSKSIEEMIKEEIRLLGPPPSLNPRSPLSSTPLVIDIVERFLGNAHLPFVELLRVYCQHRARQRTMIAKYLDTVCELQQESESTDKHLNDLAIKLDPHRQNVSCFNSWLVIYITQLFIDYIQLGFEYDLYSPFELHYVFWYLEYVYGWKQMTLKTASQGPTQELQVAGGKSKKKARNKRKGLSKEREVEINFLQVKRTVTVGVMRAYEALILDKRIPQPNFEFGSVALVFRNRFLPFTAVTSPQPLSYGNYLHLAGIDNYKGTSLNLYQAAAHHFVTAKVLLDTLPIHNIETEKLVKVIKTNLVIMNLAATGHKGKETTVPRLDFSLNREFPVVRIS